MCSLWGAEGYELVRAGRRRGAETCPAWKGVTGAPNGLFKPLDITWFPQPMPSMSTLRVA